MLRAILGLAVTITLASATMAHALEDDDPARSGPYASISFNLGVEVFEDYPGVHIPINGVGFHEDPTDDQKRVINQIAPGTSLYAPGLLDLTVAIGGKFTLGWRFYPHLALDVELEWLGKGFEATAILPTEHSIGHATPLVVTAGPKFILFTGDVQPFVGVQFGLMNMKIVSLETVTQDDSTAMRFTAGLDYYLHPNVYFGFGASYVMPFDSNSDYAYVSFDVFRIGMRY